MSGNREIKLEKLYRERDAKFEEIVSCLARTLYSTGTLDQSDRAHLIEEAEVLTNNWAVADTESRTPAPATGLQALLSEHQDICKKIIEILDAPEYDE